MECEQVLELLSAGVDGEITLEEQAQLDEHLARCPRCRALQAELAGLSAAWDGLDTAPPAELTERILANLPPQRTTGKVVYWRRWGAMAAAVALVALMAWQLPRFITDPVRDSAPVADAAVCGGGAETPEAPEAAPAAAEDALYDGVAVASLADEDALPDYVDGPGVNINAAPSHVPDPEGAVFSSHSGTSPAPQPTDGADSAAAKESDSAQANRGAAPAGGVAEDFAKRMAEDGADSGAAMASLTFADEDVSEEAVAEEAPSTGAVNAPAEAREVITEEARTYCGVLTLEEYEPAGDYPMEVFPGGRKYTLPTSDFFALVEALEQSGQPYKLQPGAFANTRPGLVIVTGGEE